MNRIKQKAKFISFNFKSSCRCNLFTFSIIILLLVSNVACKKDSKQDPDTAVTPVNPVVTTNDTSAIFICSTNINYDSVNFLGAFEQKAGVCLASFGNGTSPSSNAGTVQLNSNVFNYSSSGSYSPLNNGQGTLFNELENASTLVWQGSGNTSNNIDAFSHDIGPMPRIDSIDSPKIIPLGSGYLFTCTGIQNADSVIYSLKSANGETKLRRAGNVTQILFSNVDIGVLGLGDVDGTITAKSVLTKTVDGKKYYYIKQAFYRKLNMKVS